MRKVLKYRAMRYQPAFSVAFCAFLGVAAILSADTPPVHLRIRLAGAREAPPTLDDMLFMAVRPASREWTLDLPEVGTVTNGYQGVKWFEQNWKRPTYLFEYSGLINVPAGADYTFFVRKPTFGPVYLLVNGEPIVDFPNRGAGPWRRTHGAPPRDGPPVSSEWLEGDTIHLEKGMAEFRAMGFCEREVNFGMRWKTVSQSEPQPIPPNLFAHAEKLRFATVSRPLVYRAVDARLAGVPPFCFAEDAVRPEIHVRGNVKEVEVAVSLYRRVKSIGRCAGTDVLASTSTVAMVKGWGRVEMPECHAADYERIEWTVRDSAGELANGVAKFVFPPFDVVPDGVYGDALTCGGTNCIFVARRFGRTTNPGGASVRDAVFVNGFGADATNLLEVALSRAFEGHAPRLSHTIDVRQLVSADEALFAPPDLVAVVRLLDETEAGTVVLAPEIGGRADGEDLGAFERRLAAVAGLFAEALGCELALVTPPPEMTGGVADMRAYAAVIHRVADAYGLRVADIYTLARTGAGGGAASGPPPHFSQGDR